MTENQWKLKVKNTKTNRIFIDYNTGSPCWEELAKDLIDHYTKNGFHYLLGLDPERVRCLTINPMSKKWYIIDWFGHGFDLPDFYYVDFMDSEDKEIFSWILEDSVS